MLDDSDSDSGSSSSSLDALKINEDYASAFARRKEREELSRLKDKYGSDASAHSGESDSESETEDEDGEELTPAVDAAILRTLARIRRKDPNIYENQRNVFAEEQERTSTSIRSRKTKKDKTKPLTIKQQALNEMLNGSRSPSPAPGQPTHVEEQRELRDETINAFAQAADAEDDDFLVPREKTKDELDLEEEEYRAFLEREVGEDIAGLVEVETEEQWRQQQTTTDDADDADKAKKKKKKGKGKEKDRDEDEDQKFLLDYILNRGWIDKAEGRVPTYREVTSKPAKRRKVDHDSEDAHSNADDQVAGSGDEESVFEEAAEHFEESYMFHFQEPDAATINVHPRKIPTLVRREDTRRKEARERRKARKEEEKLRKREEVKRMKALKLKELRRKLERIGREGGKEVEDTALEALDLDGEWDPEKHDAQMVDIYGNDDPDGDIEVDEEKPQWDDDIDIGDIATLESADATYSKKQKKKKKRKRGGDDEAEAAVDEDVMDAEVHHEYDPDEEWDGTDDMRKRKLQEYMDTLDEMEFNDIVGGLPTRFKYTSVGADDYGLSPADILMATDAELNQYVGVKRYAPYRKSGAGKWDPKRGERLRELRDKLKERGVAIQDAQAEGDKKKRKGKKERMREKAAMQSTESVDVEVSQHDGDSPKKKKKRKTQEADEA